MAETPVPSPTPDGDWRTGLTGDYAALAQEPALESFKGKDFQEVAPALAKAFVETKKLVGTKQTLRIPGEGATAEEIAAYRKAIGVPETVEGYHLTRPDIAADGDWDEAAEQEFLVQMHKLGTPPHVVQAILNWYGEFLGGRHTAYRNEAEAARQALAKEWGPNYAANLGRANRAIQEYGGDALVDLFAQNGMGRHPLVVRTFAKIGNDLVEHGAMVGDTLGHLLPGEARDRVTELQAKLLKVPVNSDQAKDIINQIVTMEKIAMGAKA